MKVLSNGQWVDWSGAPPFNVPANLPSDGSSQPLLSRYGDAIWDSINPIFPQSMDGYSLYQNMTVTKIPKYPETVTRSTYMFYGCIRLTTAPPIDFSAVSSATSMFSGCQDLKSVSANFTSVTNADSMFSGCRSITSISAQFTSLTTANSMFKQCYLLKDVPPISLDNMKDLSSMRSMFDTCKSLVTVQLTGKPSSGDTYYMFNGCASLVEAPPIDMSNITSSTSMFSGCSSLTKVGVFNFTRSLAVSGAKLDVAAINTLFTNAGTAYNSSQTIDVRSNPGSAGCDPTIATAKGWTVLR